MNSILLISCEVCHLIVQFIRKPQLESIPTIRKNLPILGNVFWAMFAHQGSVGHIQ